MKNERFNQVVALAVGAAMVLIAQALGVSNVSMAVYQAYGELASLLVAGLIGLILFAAPIVLLTMYGKKQEETASPKVPTPSPAIRANPPAPIPEYPHAPPVATSNPDDLVQQMSESAPYPPDQSQSSVLLCSECGHENPAEVNFCTKCRAKMTLECNKCGFKSPQGSEFCGSCGEDTEFRVEKRARNAASAAAEAAARVREAEARTALIPVDRYFDNGQLEVKGGTKGGKLHGLYERYYENGQLRSRAIHKNGKQHGPYEYYDENGQLAYRGTYNMDSRCGTWIVDRKTVTYDPCPPGLEDGN